MMPFFGRSMLYMHKRLAAFLVSSCAVAASADNVGAVMGIDEHPLSGVDIAVEPLQIFQGRLAKLATGSSIPVITRAETGRAR